jgi:outer membrane receptor protein involved in Fe transport
MLKIREIRITSLVVLFSVMLVGPLFAQTETGSISGTVHDPSGGVIVGAGVSAKNVGTGVERTTKTGDVGQYTIPGLPPGQYDLAINQTGFAVFKSRVDVTVGSHVTVDAALTLSEQQTTVEVIAPVGGGTEINTTNSEVSQLVTAQQIEQLPSLTRDPYDFIALAGNISNGDRGTSLIGNPQLTGGGQNSADRGVGFSINGQRASGTEILLDGVENAHVFDTTVALLIPQDAVQAFRVITNNFDPQYGRASGGVVNVVTKSGTNNFHGDAWEFNRLSAYTANTFDNNASGVPKGHYTRNQFGYDVGGPIKKDKLFFYQSTEWLRVRSSASVLAYVPTPQFLAAAAANTQAYFSAYGNQNFTFISTVPKSALNFNPGLSFDNAFPSASTPIFGLVNYTAPFDAGGDLPENTYTLIGRVDYNPTANTQMFFRYGRESLLALPGSIFASPYPQYGVGQSIYDNSFLLSATHTFSPNVLSTTKLSFFRDDVTQQYNLALQATPTLFLYNNATVNGTSVQLPGFSDFTTGSGGLPFGGPQNTPQISEDLSWTRGRHSMKYGGQFTYIQMNQGYGAYAQAVEQVGANIAGGLDNFINGALSNFTSAVSPGGQFPCAAGAYGGSTNTKRGALILTPECTLTSFPLANPSFTRSYRYKDWALYAQDSWRVTPRFTFNYGVRYEHYGVQHNNNPNLDSNLYYGSGATIFEQIHNGSMLTVPNSPIHELWKPRWGTVGPRIGFAYDLFGDGKTSLRGGYGISYERNFGNVTFNMIQNPPAYATVSVSNTPLSVSNLGPLAGSTCPTLPTPCGLPPVSPRNVAQDINVAQTQFWGFSLERQLGAKAMVALEYNGAHGVHLYDLKNLNQIGGGQVYLGQPLVTSDPNNAACTPATPCFTRPNQQFTSINNRGSSGFSHYNALNVRFQTQELGHTGLSIQSNYTWAHSLDNLSSTFSSSSSSSDGVGNLGYLDPRNPRLDYGSADFDIRHRIALTMSWIEPYLKGSHGVVKQVGAGWSISPIFTARTGTAFSIADSSNCLNCLTGPYGIPRYVPAGPISSFSTGSGTSIGANNFNLLTLPADNSFTGLLGVSDFGPYPAGMTSRGIFFGPGAWSFDMALSKNFRLTERFALEFRAEGFDLFNHSNMYLNGFRADAANFGSGPVRLEGKKGGLGVLSENSQHDERRFGQFALRLHF